MKELKNPELNKIKEKLNEAWKGYLKDDPGALGGLILTMNDLVNTLDEFFVVEEE